MTETWRVQPAVGSELPGAARLAVQLSPGWDEAALRELVGAGRGRVWLARAAGGASRPPLGVLVEQTVADEVHVHALVVEARWRRRGVAAVLLCRALAGAARRGGRIAHLELRPSNRAALRLYSELGFAPVGRRPGYYADGEDALLLSTALEAVAGACA